jgi:hypothetical protein
LQGYQSEYGYTDIEIDVPSVGCCIIEAKRGWNLPGKKQLTKYAARDSFRAAKKKRLVVLRLKHWRSDAFVIGRKRDTQELCRTRAISAC